MKKLTFGVVVFTLVFSAHISVRGGKRVPPVALSVVEQRAESTPSVFLTAIYNNFNL